MAVTLSIEEDEFLKTALFQLKCGDDFSAEIERKQLRDAHADPRTGDRSFVLAIDNERRAFHVSDTKSLLKQFDGNQRTKLFGFDQWTPISEWVLQWLKCEVGLPSEPDDPNSVERLLQSYQFDPDMKLFTGRVQSVEAPDDWRPARAWLTADFVPRR